MQLPNEVAMYLLQELICNNKTVKEADSDNYSLMGKIVLVRTCSAGVHFGELVRQEGSTVLLKDAYRIWKWGGAFTLSEVAKKGVNSESRVSCSVPFIELDRIEIIPMTKAAVESVLKNVE